MKIKQYTPAELKLRHYFFAWKYRVQAKGITVNIELEEYYKLWKDSGKIDGYGKLPGQYYTDYDMTKNVITIADCSVALFESDTHSMRHGGSVGTPNQVIKAARAAYAKSEKQMAKEVMRNQAIAAAAKARQDAKDAKEAMREQILADKDRARQEALIAKEELVAKLSAIKAKNQKNKQEIERAARREAKVILQAKKDASAANQESAREVAKKAKQEAAEAKKRERHTPACYLERKPRKTPKFYTQSEKQALRQSMKDLAKQQKQKSSSETELDEAVVNFYNNSTNPLNAKILELAKQPRTNYRNHNLIVLGVRKVQRN